MDSFGGEQNDPPPGMIAPEPRIVADPRPTPGDPSRDQDMTPLLEGGSTDRYLLL